MSKVNMQCLPPNIDLTDLSFPDDQWYNFNQEQRNTISALRRLRNGGRGGPGRGTKNGGDNVSSFGDPTSGEIIMIVIFTSLYSYHQYQVIKPQIHLIVVKIIIIVTIRHHIE